MAENRIRLLWKAWGRRLAAFTAVVLAVAALWRIGKVWAGIMSGGDLSIPFPSFSATGGGDSMHGGTLGMSLSVGQTAITPMSGGTLELHNGIVASQPSAETDLSSAHVFPNPYKPSLGHRHLVFRGLTSNAKVRVYTIAGELVKELSKSDPATNDLNWEPVTNSAGQPLASGVYLYSIEGDSCKATGKLMVIK